LNPFDRSAHRIGDAADGFELCAGEEVGAGFVGSAHAVQHEAAKIIGPGVAAAVGDGRGERIVSHVRSAGEKRVDAASVKFLEDALLAVGRACRDGQDGGQTPNQFPGHERHSLVRVAKQIQSRNTI